MTEGGKSEKRIITDLRAKLLTDRTIELVEKTTEHQLKKDLLQFNAESIQEKKKILNEEKANLEEIKEKIYNLENDFCESVWKFSREHDFGNFLINYPRVKTPTACNCEFYKETAVTVEKELQENAEIQKLTREVDALKLELETLANDKNLEEELKKASEELKCASDEDAEIQRLTKVLQNSQQELEFLQTKIEKYLQEDLFSKNLETDSSLTGKKKITTNEEKLSKKLKFIKKTPRTIKNHPLTCSNTIDNYLILKGNKAKPTEEKICQNEDEKLIDESKISNEIKYQDKSGILSSWTRNSDDNVFLIGIENSIKETCTFLERTKKNPSIEIEDLEKSAFFASKRSAFENSKIKSLVTDQKSISRGFTPKKQSAIAEKCLKKH